MKQTLADKVASAFMEADKCALDEMNVAAAQQGTVESDRVQGLIRATVKYLLKYSRKAAAATSKSVASPSASVSPQQTMDMPAHAVGVAASESAHTLTLASAPDVPTGQPHTLFHEMMDVNSSGEGSGSSTGQEASSSSPRLISIEQHELCSRAATTVWGSGAQPRDFQKEAVCSMLLGADTVLSTPTGSGKTGTAALLAAAMPGLHLVLAPTNALQHSICVDMHHAGVLCAPAPSSMVPASKCFSKLKSGSIPSAQDCQADCTAHGLGSNLTHDLQPPFLTNTFVIVASPEQALNQKALHEVLGGSSPKLQAIIVDEAHVYHSWKTFRRDMGDMSIERGAHSGVPFLLMSAALTRVAIEELIRTFQLKNAHTIHRAATGQDKGVVVMAVHELEAHTTDADKERLSGTRQDYAYLHWALTTGVAELQQEGCAIVFVHTREDCKTAMLAVNKLMGKNTATLYHGTEDPKERQKMGGNLTAWLDGSVPVIVSTTALAMGVHNARCVRVIVHNIPENAACLFQMIGRARVQRRTFGTLIRVCRRHRSTMMRIMRETSNATEIAEYVCLFNALHNMSQEGANAWPSLRDHFGIAAVPLSTGRQLASHRRLNVQPLLKAVGDYLTFTGQQLSLESLRKACQSGILADIEQGCCSSNADEPTQTLAAALLWLEASPSAIPNAAYDSFICLGIELGFFDVGLHDKVETLLPSTREVSSALPALWTPWLEEQPLPQLCTEHVSGAMPVVIGAGVPSAAQSPLSPPAEAAMVSRPQQAPRTLFLGTATQAAEALNKIAENEGCLFEYSNSGVRSKTGLVAVLYRCACKLPSRQRKFQTDSTPCPVFAVQHLNSKTDALLLRVSGAHNHPACKKPPAGHFPGRDGAETEQQYSWYRGLPQHPQVDDTLRRVFNTTGHQSPMAISRELPRTLAGVSDSISSADRQLPQRLRNTPEFQTVLNTSGLVHLHGLHSTCPAQRYILNFMFRLKQQRRGGKSMWQALTQFVQDSDPSTFSLHDTLRQSGSSNDGWLFMQTENMKEMTRDDVYAKSLSSTSYEDDTGGLIQYKSKLFVWMVRSPHTHRGIPVAYMLYVHGNNEQGTDAMSTFRSDGLVRALVWSYRAIEHNSSGMVNLQAKMMDKCSHGHAAWAVFQAGKLRAAISAALNLLDSDRVMGNTTATASTLSEAAAGLQSIPDLPDPTKPGSIASSSVTSAKWSTYTAAQSLVALVAELPGLKPADASGADQLEPVRAQLRASVQAKIFLCVFHAHKACCENMMTRVPSSAKRTEMGAHLSGIYTFSGACRGEHGYSQGRRGGRLNEGSL